MATQHHTTQKRQASTDTAAITPPRTLDILVLEDDDSTRRLLDTMLAGLGHRVIGSKSVKEANALLKTFLFDLLLCDLQLPDGTGLDVVKHMPKEHKLYKIIISGHSEPEDIAKSKAAGFDAHLVKPVDIALLQRTVWQLTGQPL